jgi:hypothetical protein
MCVRRREGIIKIFRKTYISIAFKTMNTMKDHFCTDHNLSHAHIALCNSFFIQSNQSYSDSRHVMYKLKCDDCRNIYVEQARRHQNTSNMLRRMDIHTKI